MLSTLKNRCKWVENKREFAFVGDLYTSTAGGKIIRVRNDQYKVIAQIGDPDRCEEIWDVENCPRPLGMKFDSRGMLYVVEPYLGLYKVDVRKGRRGVTRLMSTKRKIGGKRPTFLDDLVIYEQKGKSPVVYMTDASTKWDLKYLFFSVGEHDETGRVIKFNTKTRKTKVVMKNLGFGNGLELTDDKQNILVCEFNNRRIMKLNLNKTRGSRDHPDVFRINLPGEPDNIRRSTSKKETYWVALATGRSQNQTSRYLDDYALWPKVRKAALRVTHLFGFMIEYFGRLFRQAPIIELGYKIKTGSYFYKYVCNYGMVIEMDANGKILRSFHSPDGRTTLLSEAREVVLNNTKMLYLGSYVNNYLGKLILPKPVKRK